MPASPPATIREAAKLLGEWKVSSVELTEAALERARSAQPRLNAFIEIEDEIALDQAKKTDSLRARGVRVGPLHGIPLAHKDMFAQAGRICGCGSRIRASHVPQSTSNVMQRLESAGAVSLGRLNMSEFALGPTGHNAHYGRALNPIVPERISGGSSSGSGAAVGGGVLLGALGSDTGGSIRLPAACCGAVGIKPTQGRVSTSGAMPLSSSQDCIGPLARNVEDAYCILQAISMSGTDPALHNTPALMEMPGNCKHIRVGVLQGTFVRELHPAVENAVELAARRLAKVCKTVTAAPCPDFSMMPELTNVVAMAEAAAFHYDWMRSRPEEYGPQTRVRLAQGLAIPGPIYLRALHMRGPLLAQFLETAFSEADILIAPVMPFLPPEASQVDAGDTPEMADVISRLTSLTRPFSYLGLPVVSVPVATSREEGLPIGLQIIARPWREDLAAAVAASLERASDLPPITDHPADSMRQAKVTP